MERDRFVLLRVPPYLTDVLQACLDSLSLAERTILQQAAVVNRIFFWDRIVLHAIDSGGIDQC